jgi:hypothetical protein
MNKPNIYNFFKFLKNKAGKELKDSSKIATLKLLYSPNDLSKEDLEELPKVQIEFQENIPKDFPFNLPVSDIKLSGDKITEVPADLGNVQSLTISRAVNLQSIPPLKLTDLSIWKSGINKLPEGLEVTGHFFLQEIELTLIPKTEEEIRLLSLNDLPIKTLEGVNARSIYLNGSLPNLKELPENLNIGLSLSITKTTAITQLPKGLKVNWNLDLLCEPQFDTLPDDLQVGKEIKVLKMPSKYPEHLKDKIKVVV